MERIAVLIIGDDTEYNEALAAALSETQKDLFVACTSCNRFMTERKSLVEKYDVILTDRSLPDVDNSKIKTIILQNRQPQVMRDQTDNLLVFKFQSIKTLSLLIREEYLGICCEPNEDGYKLNEIKLILIIDAVKGIYNGIGAPVLSRALSMSDKKSVFMDFTEFSSELPFSSMRKSEKTWDDFIYYAVYGKNNNSLQRIEDLTCLDESGLMYFVPCEGRNSFYNLERDEIRQFFHTVGKTVNCNYALLSLNAENEELCRSLGMESDLIIILNSGDAFSKKESEMLITAIEDERSKNHQGSGRFVSICVGGKWEMEGDSDFALPIDRNFISMPFKAALNTDIWEMAMRIARYIGDGSYDL